MSVGRIGPFGDRRYETELRAGARSYSAMENYRASGKTRRRASFSAGSSASKNAEPGARGPAQATITVGYALECLLDRS